jgi:hypothetical protein
MIESQKKAINQAQKNEQEMLDSDIAARTAMLFGLEVSRQDACGILGVPWNQADAWEDLWDELEVEAKEKALEG